MLTADEQYVFIQMVVQYRRTDPVKYSFEVVDPEATVQDVTESALREVIGTSELETVVTGERDRIANRTLETSAGDARPVRGRHHRLRRYRS